jgi:hypothetical protein
MAFGDPNPTYSLPMVTPGAGFNAMLTRFYDEFGNVQGRNEKAFGHYEEEKWREADAYNRMIQEQERQRREEMAARNRMEQEKARARQLEDQARREAAGDKNRARMEQRGAANAQAAQLQNLSSPIDYRFTDPRIAAQALASELPYRYAAMAQGEGQSAYGGEEGDSDQFAAMDQFRTRTTRPGYGY